MKVLSVVAVVLALHGPPAISLTPDSGPAGSSFDVVGVGFEPGQRVKIVWNGEKFGGTIRADAGGSFTFTILVADDALPGEYQVDVTPVGGGTTLSAIFTVPDPNAPIPEPEPLPQPEPLPPPKTAVVSDPVPTTQPDWSSTDVVFDFDPVRVEWTGGIPGTRDAVTTGDDRSVEAATEPDVQVEAAAPSFIRSGFMGLMIGLILVLGAAATAFFLFGSRKKKDVEEFGEGRREKVVPAPAPLTVAEIEGETEEWVRNVTVFSEPGQINHVVSTKSGFIGVGNGVSGQSLVWNSEDGIHWDVAQHLGNARAVLAVPWRSGAFVAGANVDEPGSPPTRWVGDDRGVWLPLGDVSDPILAGVSFEGVAERGGTLYAWGRSAAGPGVWYSPDGVHWAPSTLRGEFDLISGYEGGLLAFGRDGDDRRPVVAKSEGGDVWDSFGEDPRLREVSVASLGSFRGGLAIGGYDFANGAGTICLSDTGEDWFRIPFDAPAGTSVEHLAVIGDRMLAVGTDTRRRRGGMGEAMLWQSKDAVSWEPLEVPELFADAAVTSLTVDRGSALLSGVFFDQRDGAYGSAAPVSWKWTPDVARQTASPAPGDYAPAEFEDSLEIS